ncbi:MAG TPA: hypothetical protein VHM16_06250 [Rubrobacteraceae bacterium]|nr:hypothetical protein [Rubrobacteraceae bacterium]
MNDKAQGNRVKIRATSPGRYPILIVELANGALAAAYRETGYDLDRTKPVGHEWVRENAIGRHSFVEVEPPVELPASALGDYVRKEITGEG